MGACCSSAQAVTFDPEKNEAVGKTYTLGRVLGRGTYAVVRHGVCRATGHEAAVKIYDKRSLKNSKSKNMLKKTVQEVKIMRMFAHPNIIQVLGHRDEEEYIYILMELVTGGEVRTRESN